MPDITAPANQNFECRDCPARCCTAPWRLVVQEEEKKRFEAESWIQERFAQKGVAIQPLSGADYVIPYVVHDRKLQCVFLDDDNLCSMYKRHGRDFWPHVCRSFPFEFIVDETGAVQTALTHYCPSIRDNYGDPLTQARLEAFLKDSGGHPTPMAPVQHLGVQTQLKPHHYMRLVGLWVELIKSTPSLHEALFACHQLTEHLEMELLDHAEVDDAVFTQALETAQSQAKEPFQESPTAQRQSALLPNLVLALHLSSLAYPVRTYYVGKFSLGRIISTWLVRLKLIRQSGPIDLLLLPRSFQLEDASTIPVISTDPILVERIRNFLLGVIQRRYFLRRESRMETHLFQLILGYITILRMARYHAAARKSLRVELPDLLEGISSAELLIFYHNYPLDGPLLGPLISSLSKNTLSLRKFLLSEM